MTLIDGKQIAQDLQQAVIRRVKALKKQPHLAIVLVGDNPSSQIYVRNKCRTAEKLGIKASLFHLSPVMTADSLADFIKGLNKDTDIDGIILQLPLPFPLQDKTFDLVNTIDPEKDVDGLTMHNLGLLFLGQPYLIPGTPKACLTLIHSVLSHTQGLNAVVVGRSFLVGRPLTQLLLQADMTVTNAHSKTRELKSVCQTADVLISATGVPHLIQADFVKPGAVVIDVGIYRQPDNRIVGDVDFDHVKDIAKAITPVPGGVGPMTIAMIWENLLQICEGKK